MTTMTMTAPVMSEELAQLVRTAARELREVIECGEHPLAAEGAVRLAYGRSEWERHEWGTNDETEQQYHTLAAVLTCCEKASRYYEFSQEAACEQLLLAANKLQPLADAADAMREVELRNW